MQITQEQVEEFMVKVARFSEKFKSEGPGSVGTDLDKGTSYCVPFREITMHITGKSYILSL